MNYHREKISSGVHTDKSPRGLNAGFFGPAGSGWKGVADRVISGVRKAPAECGVLFWCFGGHEPDGSISDRPFDSAMADDSFTWDKLWDMDALGSALGRIKMACRGPIAAYIGAPRSPEPDSVIFTLCAAGLIDEVHFDATAHQPAAQRDPQWARYEALGVRIGYEAVPNCEAADLWASPSRTLCCTLRDWVIVQDKIAGQGWHPNRNVPGGAVQSKILLLDERDDVANAKLHISKGYDLAINMLAPAWAAELAAGGA